MTSSFAQAVSALLAAHGEQITSDVDPYTPRENLWLIVSKPDNIPIIMMIIIFAFFTYLAMRDAMKHDRLIRQGRKQDVLKAMQE